MLTILSICTQYIPFEDFVTLRCDNEGRGMKSTVCLRKAENTDRYIKNKTDRETDRRHAMHLCSAKTKKGLN